MSNLLAIETSFLNLPQVKQILNLTEIRSTQRVIANGQKKKFEQTLQLSKLVVSAVNWFASEEGKRICTEEGISWNNEEIGIKIFGWQKSFFYKVVKAGKLETTVIESFNTKCTEIESQGSEANRSLEGLLKYAKQLNTATTEATEGEGEGEGEQTDIQPEIVLKNILTFKFKNEQFNVLVKIAENGNLTTNNTKSEIKSAILFLEGVLSYNNLQLLSNEPTN
jgi:hypothetical protein